MATGPEVKVTLTAEDTGVSAAIKELGNNLKNLKKTQDSAASSAHNLSNALKTIGIGAAIGALAYKFVALGKSVFESGVNIARMAQMTGASAGLISAAYYKASEELGIDTSVVDKAFVRLSKSIIEFQQGSSIATKAFHQLGITTKDFTNLNTDQKIRLVTDRLGELKAGTEKAGLAQLILSRSGATALPVLNALAGKGFAEATREAKRFGLYLDGDGARSMLHMKQELGDIEGEAKGATLQFELGLVPALADVAGAIADAISGVEGGGNGFKRLGEEAGSVAKAIAFGFLSVGESIGNTIAEIEVEWDFAMNHMKSASKAVFASIVGYVTGGVGGAASAGAQSLAESKGGKDLADQLGAIEKEHEAAQQKLYDNIYGAGAKTVPNAGTKPGQETADQLTEMKVREQAAADQLAKARAGRARAGGASRLSVERATFAQQEEQLKGHYDRAEISAAEYYAKLEEFAGTQAKDEVTDLQKQIVEQQALRTRALREAAANRRAGADKSLTPQLRNEYIQAANRQALEAVSARQAIAGLQAKIQTTEIEAQTKIGSLRDKQAAKDKENAKVRLGFEDQMLKSEGKTFDAAINKIKEEAAEYAKAGGTVEQVAAFSKQENAQAFFEKTAGDSRTGMQQFEIQKKTIEIRAKSGKLGKLAEEREINQLIAQRIPLLQQQAQAELAAARASGNMDDIQKAQNQVQAVQNLKVQTTSLAAQMRGPITQSFTGFFETVGRGTETVQRSFENLAGGIIAALQKVLMQKLMEKILGTDSSSSGGSGGGGEFGGLLGGLLGAFSHHAEGGLIRGRGGPRSDSIPAMLSSGEYVVNAAAVAAFGAHNLEAINRGLRIESIRNLGIPRFAEGGLVGPGSSGEASNIHLAVGLDEGLVLKHLSSKAAGRVVLQHLVNNPKTASKAMSRGT